MMVVVEAVAILVVVLVVVITDRVVEEPKWAVVMES